MLATAGYKKAVPLLLEELGELLLLAGFDLLKSSSLHSIYARDNERMLRRIERFRIQDPNESKIAEVHQLLMTEKKLFSEGTFSGVLRVAQKKAVAARDRTNF